MIGKVACDLLGRGWNVPSPPQEMSQIALVRPPGVLGGGGGNEFEDFAIGAAGDGTFRADDFIRCLRRRWNRSR